MNRVRLLRDHRVFRDKNAVVSGKRARLVGMRIELRRNACPQIDAVTNEPLVFRFNGLDERLDRVEADLAQHLHRERIHVGGHAAGTLHVEWQALCRALGTAQAFGHLAARRVGDAQEQDLHGVVMPGACARG
mgnify:CR=1 FL=1